MTVLVALAAQHRVAWLIQVVSWTVIVALAAHYRFMTVIVALAAPCSMAHSGGELDGHCIKTKTVYTKLYMFLLYLYMFLISPAPSAAPVSVYVSVKKE